MYTSVGVIVNMMSDWDKRTSLRYHKIWRGNSIEETHSFLIAVVSLGPPLLTSYLQHSPYRSLSLSSLCVVGMQHVYKPPTLADEIVSYPMRRQHKNVWVSVNIYLHNKRINLFKIYLIILVLINHLYSRTIASCMQFDELL